MVIQKNKGEKDLDAWLLDDEGIGRDLFGSDIGSAKQGKELDEYIEDIKAGARVAIDQSIAILTPWFFSNMPQFYYETTPREEKVRDLHAIITGHIFESKQTLQLWNRERSKTTFLAPGTDDNIFKVVAKNIADLDVKHGSMFTSNDRLLLISSFFTEKYQPVDLSNEKCKDKYERALKLLDGEDCEAAADFFKGLDHDMVVHATPGRMVRLFKLYRLGMNREDAVTHLIPHYTNEYARLDVAFKKMPIAATLASFFSLFHRYGFQTNRSILATVNQHTDTPVSILTFIIRHETGKDLDEKFVPFLKLNKAAKSLRWVDQDEWDELWKDPGEGHGQYSLNEINLIRAMATWSQIFLSKKNPYYYSEERIRKTLNREPDLLQDLIHLFRVKFDPRIDESERDKLEAHIADMNERIEDVSNRISRDIILECLNFLRHVLKTNYFFPSKTGLSFRMDPTVLDRKHYPNVPFGFFFMIGRGYRGFQVRYRDTARGGMRIVMPKDASQYEVAYAGLFDEVAGLSYAQQLKNKDIPEGGSKAVILLSPGADKETAAIGATDSILNLITTNPETGKLDPSIIDYLGTEEFIYLGPDENLTNDLIDAFVLLARNRGYRFPNAFMSSKPKAGINHKEFGVTSEGVNVFLENMLSELGIDPRKKRFTIKMTGGPDGDVAGNELRILNREYGENARVVAIADGFGAAYDPEGLPWKELLRLVDESKSIMDLDPKKLSKNKKAFVIPADTKENTRIRNNLHATAIADVFIPAGGRPYTVNDENWSTYIDEDGKPSCRAIVEGANIFFTEDARAKLQEKGVLFFKDSSANKCGVICSSYEIISSLILEPEEFMKIKKVYVDQVVVKLREKADLEAKLLLREYHERGGRDNLVDLSKVVSHVINRVTDLVSEDLDKLSEKQFRTPLLDHIILDHIPDVLVERYKDRILTEIPRSYRQAVISADVASKIVYTEGITFLENLADEEVVRTVEAYVSKRRHLLELLQSLEKTEMANKDEVMLVLQEAGARVLTITERRRARQGK